MSNETCFTNVVLQCNGLNSSYSTTKWTERDGKKDRKHHCIWNPVANDAIIIILHKLKFSARRKLLAFVSSFKFNYLAARCTRQTNVSMLQNFNLKHYMNKIMRMNRMKESQKWMKSHLIFSSFLHFVSILLCFFWLSCLLVLNQIKKC